MITFGGRPLNTYIKKDESKTITENSDSMLALIKGGSGNDNDNNNDNNDTNQLLNSNSNSNFSFDMDPTPEDLAVIKNLNLRAAIETGWIAFFLGSDVAYIYYYISEFLYTCRVLIIMLILFIVCLLIKVILQIALDAIHKIIDIVAAMVRIFSKSAANKISRGHNKVPRKSSEVAINIILAFFK